MRKRKSVSDRRTINPMAVVIVISFILVLAVVGVLGTMIYKAGNESQNNKENTGTTVSQTQETLTQETETQTDVTEPTTQPQETEIPPHEVIGIDADLQYELNIFLSNFSESFLPIASAKSP